MSCPNNPFGQPACNIVAHPDRPGESFCASCSRRFHDSVSNHVHDPQITFWDFLIRILVLFIIGALIFSDHSLPDLSFPFLNTTQTRGKN